LVATAEPRNVVVSTAFSKSVLRVAAQAMADEYACVDYFPSYEIITSPLSRARFWAEGLRDVTSDGVETVMDIFFKSRMPADMSAAAAQTSPASADIGVGADDLRKAITEECDEMFLDPALRSGKQT
jgi:hypothetical protein